MYLATHSSIMKAKSLTLGCLLMSLLFLSSVAFAGNPVNHLATSNADSILTDTDSKIISTQGFLPGDNDRVKVLSDKNVKKNQGKGGVHRQNIIYAGAGFISLFGIITTVYTEAGYTQSGIPTITLAYEHGVSRHWGVGILFDYASTSLALLNAPGNPANGNGNPYSYSNMVNLTAYAGAITTSYHLAPKNLKIDPYIGAALGYTSISFTFTTTDPYASTDGNTALAIKGSDILFGGFVGIRLYLSNTIGLWTNIGYMGASSSLINVGLAAKF